MTNPDYSNLHRVLEAAYNQSAEGKGKERHANAKPFDRQPILEISRMVGLGYSTGQVMKKAQEAMGMSERGEPNKAIQELLGCIVYSAAAVLLLEEKARMAHAPGATTIPAAAARKVSKQGFDFEKELAEATQTESVK